jgi:hypothetical protein
MYQIRITLSDPSKTTSRPPTANRNVRALFTSKDPLKTDQEEERSKLVQKMQSLRRAYETLVNLSRYSQSIEERSLPLTDARVVTLASAPFEASSPKGALVVVR